MYLVDTPYDSYHTMDPADPDGIACLGTTACQFCLADFLSYPEFTCNGCGKDLDLLEIVKLGVTLPGSSTEQIEFKVRCGNPTTDRCTLAAYEDARDPTP